MTSKHNTVTTRSTKIFDLNIIHQCLNINSHRLYARASLLYTINVSAGVSTIFQREFIL